MNFGVIFGVFIVTVVVVIACVRCCFVTPNTLRLFQIPTYDLNERENYERKKDAYQRQVNEFLEVERQHKRLVAKMFNLTLTEDTAIPWGLRPWWEVEEEEE